MKQATVILRNLSIGYHNGHDVRTVIADISARLFAGEVTCLLGVNGVGKSTLLRTLSGFQPPIAGSVEISGKDIKDYGSHELAQTIGVVLTDKPDVSNMTVEEIVGMGRSPYTGFWGTAQRRRSSHCGRSHGHGWRHVAGPAHDPNAQRR